MSTTTANSANLQRRDVYSEVILDQLEDGFLPEGIARDVSDFPDGTTLQIPVFGEVVLRDVVENQETAVQAVDTGRVTLEISDYKGAGSFITDENMEDSYYMRQLDAALPGKMLRALKEDYETSMLAAGNKFQTKGDSNSINGFAHRFVAGGNGGQLDLSTFAYLKTAFLKANSPEMSMIAIVDPISELSLNRMTNLINVSNNPRAEGIMETGFGKSMQFIRNVFGWDVFMSNRLPRVATETINTAGAGKVAAPKGDNAVQTGAETITNAYAATFMCVADDMTSPLMSAWRRKPKVVYYRDEPRRRDVYYCTTRYGFGVQRPHTLGTVLCSLDNY